MTNCEHEWKFPYNYNRLRVCIKCGITQKKTIFWWFDRSLSEWRDDLLMVKSYLNGEETERYWRRNIAEQWGGFLVGYKV